MSETATFYLCVAGFAAVMACNVVALARHYLAMRAVWAVIRGLQATNHQLLDFIEVERVKQTQPRTTSGSTGDQRDQHASQGGRTRHVDGL
jgi:hypothetical protein